MGKFCVGDPMQLLFHWRALGIRIKGNANFRFGVGGEANFSIFRYQQTWNRGVGGLSQEPTRMVLHHSGNRLKAHTGFVLATKRKGNQHKNMKCTCPTPAPTPGTQHHLYSTGNWVCVCYPTRRNLHTKNEMYMADARNWRHLTQKIPTCWYPCVRWRRSAISCQIFCVLVEYRLKS